MTINITQRSISFLKGIDERPPWWVDLRIVGYFLRQPLECGVLAETGRKVSFTLTDKQQSTLLYLSRVFFIYAQRKEKQGGGGHLCEHEFTNSSDYSQMAVMDKILDNKCAQEKGKTHYVAVARGITELLKVVGLTTSCTPEGWKELKELMAAMRGVRDDSLYSGEFNDTLQTVSICIEEGVPHEVVKEIRFLANVLDFIGYRRESIIGNIGQYWYPSSEIEDIEKILDLLPIFGKRAADLHRIGDHIEAGEELTNDDKELIIGMASSLRSNPQEISFEF